MLLDLLKANLSEEVFKQVEEQLKDKELKVIPYERFKEVTEAKNTAESKILELEKSMENFKDYEENKSKLSELQEKLNGFNDYEELQTKVQTMKNELNKANLINLGVDKDLVDFALTKIDLTEDVEKNVVEFLNSNPKFKAEKFVQKNSQFKLDGKGKIDWANLTTEEYLEARKTNKIEE